MGPSFKSRFLNQGSFYQWFNQLQYIGLKVTHVSLHGQTPQVMGERFSNGGERSVLSMFVGHSRTSHHEKLESAVLPSTQEKEKQGLKG